MELRRLGNSDLKVSPVILGTWALGGWLWGGTEKNHPFKAIRTALDAGVNCIDTAPVYGFGLSEELVGKAIKGRRENVLVATKCGLVWDSRPGGEQFFRTKDNSGREVEVVKNLSKDSIISECEDSLKRLGVDVIDLYQCHWPDAATPIEESIDALESLKQQGKIREYGVSNFNAQLTSKMLDLGGSPVSNQLKYSFLSRESMEADIPFCRKNGIGVICYSPLEMGLLTGKITMETTFPEGDMRSDRPWFAAGKRREVIRALEQIRPIAEKNNASLVQLVIAATAALPGMTGAIVGARDEKQALANSGAGDISLSGEDLDAVIRIFEPLVLDEAYDPAKARR